MDNVTKNKISNILYQYRIEENANNFNKLAEVIFQKEIDIYKVIFHLIDACIIISENNYSLKIEICWKLKIENWISSRSAGRFKQKIFY